MRPKVRQLDEAVPDQEGCSRVETLRHFGRPGTAIERELEAENLGDDVAAFLAFDAHVESRLFALCIVAAVRRLLRARAVVGSPRRSSEDIDEELPVVDGIVGERVEEDVERATRVQVEIACTPPTQSRRIVTASASEYTPISVFILLLMLSARCARSAAVSCGSAVKGECGGPRFARSSTISFE